MIRTKIEEIHCDTADSSLLFKWTQILNLEITIFESKIVVKSGLDFFYI